VLLLYGKHWDRHRGFGFVHILEGHWREIGILNKQADLNSISAVATFVAEICGKGAKISCEFADIRGRHKPLIVKGTRELWCSNSSNAMKQMTPTIQ
jgi:hypothetical protein